eukprot:c23269_g1_i1 orf=544-912(+)
MPQNGCSRSWGFQLPHLAVAMSMILFVTVFPYGEAGRSALTLQQSTDLLVQFKHELQATGSILGTDIVGDSLQTESAEKEEHFQDESGEEEEEEAVHERHPADELLQLHKADGTQSYILGGY